MNPRPIIVLNTVTANGADASVSDGQLLLTGLSSSIPVKGIMQLETTIQPFVAEVLQVSTGTPTAANNTFYSVEILSYNTSQQQYVPNVYSYISDSAATATEICDGLRAAINSDPSVNVVASGTATLVLTGVTGLPIFTATNVGEGTIAFVTGTPGVIGVGLGSQIAANNPYIPYGIGIVATNQYTTVTIFYRDVVPYGDITPSPTITKGVVIYVNEGSANLSSLVGTYGTLSNALSGVQATWVATPAGTSPQLAYTSTTGALALTGTGNTWAANNIAQGDILFFTATPTVYYPVLIQSTNTAGFSSAAISADTAASAFSFVRLRPIL